MADTVRTPADLLTNLFQAGQFQGVSSQDMRDLIESLRNPFGGLSVTTPAETTISVAGTYVKAAGTTTVQPMVRLVDMPANNQLRYTGTIMRHFHIVLQSSFEFASGTNLIAALQLYHYDASETTGALVAHSLAPSVVASTAVAQITSHADLMLDTNDYIEIHIANISNTNNITVQNGYLFMVGMF